MSVRKTAAKFEVNPSKSGLTLAQEPRRKRLHKDGGQKTRSKESNSLGDFSDPHGA
jgi:hypothetical protein